VPSHDAKLSNAAVVAIALAVTFVAIAVWLDSGQGFGTDDERDRPADPDLPTSADDVASPSVAPYPDVDSGFDAHDWLTDTWAGVTDDYSGLSDVL
jgi:hypothetical protein